MPHPIYELAAAENKRALEEFERVAPEAYAAYIRSKQTMEAYESAPVLTPVASLSSYAAAFGAAAAKTEVDPFEGASGNPGLKVRVRLSEAGAVRLGARSYLEKQNGRRTSGEITKALVEAGVQIGGPDFQAKAQRVSSHLSVSPDFTNDR